MRRRTTLATAAAGSAGLLLLAPAAALAHGLVGRKDLPIPEEVFVWAAAGVLVVSFVGLATLWPAPRLQQEQPRRIATLPAFLDPLCGLIGVLIFGGVAYAGFAGTQTPTANLLPTWIYVAFWVGLVPLSLLFGDVFRAFNPWRAIARGVAWAASRGAGEGLPQPLPYPERLGRWPAVIGLLAFGWLELAATFRDDPSTLSALMLAYAAVQLIGMSLYGIEPWSRRGDAFGTYFGVIARLAPLDVEDRRLRLRRPLTGVVDLPTWPGTVPLLCVMIGVTTFDGFSQGPTWSSLAPDLQDLFTGLGFKVVTAIELSNTVGLLAGVLFVYAIYRLGVVGMHSVGGGLSTEQLANRFVHTLVPIAVAYVIAHYFSLLAYQGQALGFLLSDPLGDGSDLLGTASATVDYNVISATGIWYVQVGALVLGHVAALVLAHDRALALYDDPRLATRSQYWMLTVMVGFTCLGLWLLSSSA